MKNNNKHSNLTLLFFLSTILGSITLPLFAKQSVFPVTFINDEKIPKDNHNNNLIKTNTKKNMDKIETDKAETDKIVSATKPIVENSQSPINDRKISFQWKMIDDTDPTITTTNNTSHLPISQKTDPFVIPNVTPQDKIKNNIKQDINAIKPTIWLTDSSVKDITDTLSLSDIVKGVVHWHPVIKRSINEVNKSEETIKEAKSGYFPSLKAGVQSSFEESIYSSNRELEHNLVISLTQNIYDFGKTSSNVALAEATLNRDQFTKEQTINKLIYDTVTAYIEIVRYQNLVDIAQKQVTGFQSINQIAKQRSKLGASAYSDYSQSLVRLASAEAMLHDFTAQYLRWSAILNNLSNKQVSQRIPWQFPNGIGNSCELIDLRHFTSPEINIAEAQIKIAKAQLEKAKSEHYPTLSISPTYEYRLDDNYNTYNKKQARGDLGIFFNVSMQIMDGGGMNARTNEAEYALAAAQYNLDYERTRITQKILESSSQIKSINFSLTAQKNKEASAVRTRDLYRQQYAELGNRQFSDLINAEAEIHQTRIEIINNQYIVQKLSIECLSNTDMLIIKLMN